jgi:hypothetical protein
VTGRVEGKRAMSIASIEGMVFLGVACPPSNSSSNLRQRAASCLVRV